MHRFASRLVWQKYTPDPQVSRYNVYTFSWQDSLCKREFSNANRERYYVDVETGSGTIEQRFALALWLLYLSRFWLPFYSRF